ncbi:hypothetical protein O3P69_007426 [Scylla paramamosain]|uniref:Uncharacterized protein n=1 Tax=Scylla paramamosain TaxID=85552 RepID=A0AAW0V3E1_SCYPA
MLLYLFTELDGSSQATATLTPPHLPGEETPKYQGHLTYLARRRPTTYHSQIPYLVRRHLLPCATLMCVATSSTAPSRTPACNHWLTAYPAQQ